MSSTSSKVRMDQVMTILSNNIEETKAFIKDFTEEETRRGVAFLVEEAEGAEEEDFSRKPCFVSFVGKTKGIPLSTARSPYKRKRS